MRVRQGWIRLSGVTLLSISLALAGEASAPYRVSQKGRAFLPHELSIRLGDVVRVVNDDGDLLHHAYVDSPAFRFDSGDQAPGASVDISFPVRGEFEVLCGIHPKMRLLVHVE